MYYIQYIRSIMAIIVYKSTYVPRYTDPICLICPICPIDRITNTTHLAWVVGLKIVVHIPVDMHVRIHPYTSEPTSVEPEVSRRISFMMIWSLHTTLYTLAALTATHEISPSALPLLPYKTTQTYIFPSGSQLARYPQDNDTKYDVNKSWK